MLPLIPSNRHIVVYVDHNVDVPDVIEEVYTQSLGTQYEEFFNDIPDECFNQVDENLVKTQGTVPYPTGNVPIVVDDDEEAAIPNESDDEAADSDESDEEVAEGDGEASLHNVPSYEDSGDESDKEIYDEENDAALEDNYWFQDNVEMPKVPVFVEKKKQKKDPVFEEKKKKNDESFIPKVNMEDNLPEENYNSDGFASPTNSDGEGHTQRFAEFNPDTDMENPQFKIGMIFGSKHQLREAFENYVVMQGYEVKVTKNDAKRMQAKCLKCKWSLWASFMEDKTLQIRSLTDKHTCSRSYSNPQATSSFLAKKYIDLIRDEPKISLRTLHAHVKRDIGLDISFSIIGRAR
jgi:hypothetical protein